MLKKINTIIVLAVTISSISLVHAVAKEAGATDAENKGNLQQRIDFGNAYIMGQSMKSGAVYLLHRKKSDISSMMKIRTDYRDEIIDEFALEDTQLISKEADEKKE